MSNVNQKNKEFALSLVKSESEQEVEGVLEEYGFKNNERAWCSLNESAVIDNQQSIPERALVEKIINSVDAILIKKAREKYSNPCHPDAPSSMKEAVSEFFGVGDISTLEAKDDLKKKMPGDISVSVTGSERSPSVTIADLGEGQSPEDFPNTFMRLTRSPKVSIQFVQGKYGMGGTGALRFCGDFSYNLVLSKKNIEGTGSQSWGFTIFRRLKMSPGDRLPKYVYLKPDNEILSFNAESLDIYPTRKGAYTGDMRAGTFVKLYQYDLTNKSHTNFDTYRTLSKLIPDIALPVTVFEHREAFENRRIVLDGLRARLLTSAGNNVPEPGFPSHGSLSVEGTEMNFEIFAFKGSSEIKNDYARADSVIFMNNGQNQGSIAKNEFFRSTELKRVNFDYIKDSILILLYCDSLTPEQGRQVFLADRETLTSSELVRRIKVNLVRELAGHQGLLDLAQRRRQENLSKSADEFTSFVNSFIPKILAKNVIDQLDMGIDVPGGSVGTKTGVGQKKEFKGKKYPSFFSIEGDQPKFLPVNGKYVLVTFNTDVRNDYFNRKNSAGKLVWENKEPEHFDSSWNLWEGKLKLTISPLGKFFIGQRFKFHLNITDETQKIPFQLSFDLQIVKKKLSVHKKKPKDPKEREPKYAGGKSIPEFTPVRTKEWDKHGFNGWSAIKVTHLGENKYDYYINMDNRYLLNESKKRPDDREFHEKQYRLAMTLITLNMVGQKDKILEDLEEIGAEENSEEYFVRFVKDTTSTISSLIFPLINELSKRKALLSTS